MLRALPRSNTTFFVALWSSFRFGGFFTTPTTIPWGKINRVVSRNLDRLSTDEEDQQRTNENVRREMNKSVEIDHRFLAGRFSISSQKICWWWWWLFAGRVRKALKISTSSIFYGDFWWRALENPVLLGPSGALFSWRVDTYQRWLSPSFVWRGLF